MGQTMSEFAQPTNTSNPIMNPVVYFRVAAFALTAVFLLGVVMAIIEPKATEQPLAFHSKHGLGLSWTHNAVHAVLAAACFIFGFANMPGNVVKTFAIIFGFVYAGLGILGFFVSNPLGSALALNLGVSLNVVHLLLGAWALLSGFGSRFD